MGEDSESRKILLDCGGGQDPSRWRTRNGLGEDLSSQYLFDRADRYPGNPHSKGDVIIANDAMILSAVRIGDGAVISARSLHTQDVPSYAVVGGNPAKIIKFRFDEKTRML